MNAIASLDDTFTPEDTEDTMYMCAHHRSIDFSEIWEKAREKWPRIQFDELSIEADYIHTRCIGYDLFDGADWDNYLIITASPSYFDRMNEKETAPN